MMRPIIYTFVVCAACGSTEPPGGDDAALPQPCEPSDDTVALDAEHGWALHAMAVDERGPWVVLEKRQNNLSSFVIADAEGEGPALLEGLDVTLQMAAVVVDGKRCIAAHSFDEVFRFACEDGTLELPGLDLGGRVSAVAARGAVHVFGQDFAAYHELRRVSGNWQEVEKFESSISSAEDAVLFSGDVTSCFLSTGDQPSIDREGDITYGADTARWCRLIAGSELGVLTDNGLATFTGDAIGAAVPTGIEVRPLAVGRRDGTPFAVVHRDDPDNKRVELQPLPSGAPTLLRTLAGAENAHAAIDGDRVSVISVKPIFDAGATRYELLSSIHCN